MPKRTDIKSILIIGSGPIVIGQACEFDYSGTQACVALKEEGYKIILINSNPATIMTDPDLADVTYIEPITADYIEKIIELEKPDAILPTMGGQTALNCAVKLHESGFLKKHNVELIGASYEAIQKAEDREKFKELLKKINLKTPKSFVAKNTDDIQAVLSEIGLPVIVRPSFTLGGFGGGVVYTEKEYLDLCLQGLSLSPQHEIQIDESIYGWKEYELEVMRDKNNNAIIVCSVENVDPVGIHTGDSITVAPAQTLSDKEYQAMRHAAILIMQEVGVESGGANVQFAVNPLNGEMVVIEMNPRVSRSSALASKATGYPIARIAAKLAVGFTLDELTNDITSGKIPASFEPTIDYVVTKIPRFDLDKFPGVSHTLGSQMKSVGEVMAIGRTFQESFQKAMDSLESDFHNHEAITDELLATPSPYRFLFILDALRCNKTVSEIHELTKIDNWFLYYMKDLVDMENKVKQLNYLDLSAADWKYIKQKGFSDARLAILLNITENAVREARKNLHCLPSYKKIDTCAGEFATPTDYIYSSYDSAYIEQHEKTKNNKKIIILGSGPNRIGQGIEFDYCCVHAVQAVREAGFTAIMINCNPETVSTDYNISDKLYFEPVTFEKVMDVIEAENPMGVIVQLGGQTPLKLVEKLQKHSVPILGSNYEAIHKAESREEFKSLMSKLGFLQPVSAIANNPEEVLKLAEELHYPLIIRPSYVLGGRAMKIVHNHSELEDYLNKTTRLTFEHPLLLEHFVENAIEIDVDAVCDGAEVIICGVMEHIERVGVHSGDSACCFPVFSITSEIEEQIKRQMTAIALELGAIGLINAQFAVKDGKIYIIEVNPRASRTIPFISKATGIAWVKVAVNCMLGETLYEQNIKVHPKQTFYAVKESVFPFSRLPGSIPVLGPEMKSTGEVMGFGQTFYEAFYKAQSAAMVFKKSLFTPDKFILMTGGDAAIVELIKPLNINIILDENLVEVEALIKSGAVVFMINLTGFSQHNVSSLFLLGVRLGISYVTSVPALLGILGSLASTEDYQSVKAIQKYYK